VVPTARPLAHAIVPTLRHILHHLGSYLLQDPLPPLVDRMFLDAPVPNASLMIWAGPPLDGIARLRGSCVWRSLHSCYTVLQLDVVIVLARQAARRPVHFTRPAQATIAERRRLRMQCLYPVKSSRSLLLYARHRTSCLLRGLHDRIAYLQRFSAA